jgi:Tol biopolymer transport system component
MVSGQPPFVGQTPTDIVIAIVEREQPAISEHVAEVPNELERIVRKALRKDPEERYQIVKEVAVDLRSLQKDLDIDRSIPPGLVESAKYDKRTPTSRGRKVDTDQVSATRLTGTGSRAIREISWAARIGVVALIASIIAAGAFGIYKLSNRGATVHSSAGRFQQVNVTKLTTNGNALFASISPDGKYVTYIKGEGGKESLWLRQVGTTGNLEIVPPREGHYGGMSFSPDGKFIYYGYAQASDNVMELFRVPTLGTGTTPMKVSPEEGPRGHSSDGKRIAFVDYDRAQRSDLLKVANADGTGEQVVATRKWPDRFSYDFSTAPVWTKDDQSLELPVVKNDAKGYYFVIYEIRLDTRAEKVIPVSQQRFELFYHVTLLSDLSGLITSGKIQGASFAQVWLLGVDGSARAITNDLSDYQDADLTDDSSALVTVQTQTLSNIWVGAKGDVAHQTQITSGLGRYFDLSWAPDGKIVYASDASGSADIFEVAASGGAIRQLTSGMNRNYAPVVSPDNRFIALHSNRSGVFQIWRMDRDGSNPVQLMTGNSESNWPCFSADAKWVFYEHFEAGVSGTLWKVPVEGGTPIKVTEGFSLRPVISPDGKWLGFWQSDGKADSRWHLSQMSLETGKIVKTFEVAPTVHVQWDTQLRWTSDSKSLAYIDTRAGIENIWTQSIDGGPAKQLTNFTESRIFSFDWSRDGSLVSSRGVITSDVVLISDAKQ